MNRWNTILVLVTSLTLAGLIAACSEMSPRRVDQEPARGVDYLVTWVDMPEEKKFLVRLESMSKRELCTGPGRWPSSSGYIGGSGLSITVRVDSVEFRYRDSDMEMCAFRDCQNPMRRGTVLESVLTYEGFGIPPQLVGSPKALSFDPEPYWCRAE